MLLQARSVGCSSLFDEYILLEILTLQIYVMIVHSGLATSIAQDVDSVELTSESLILCFGGPGLRYPNLWETYPGGRDSCVHRAMSSATIAVYLAWYYPSRPYRPNLSL